MAAARGALAEAAAALRGARVRVVEVGPRDGLQNEAAVVPAAAKLRLVSLLNAAGLPSVELTGFVSPKWVPQLADALEVAKGAEMLPGVRYPVLVPNMKGYERALEAGMKEVAVFTAASDAFCRRNTNCTVDESFDRFAEVMRAAERDAVEVRGYVSVAVGCPYSGAVDPTVAAKVARRLLDLGCYEVSLGDTTGVGTPGSVGAAVDACVDAGVPVDRLALHLHDTFGQACANVYAGLLRGVRVFDASVAGLGGCPYSPGSSGNVATEDVVYMLDGLGVEHGIDAERLTEASEYISGVVGKQGSKVTTARLAQRAAGAAVAAAAAQ